MPEIISTHDQITPEWLSEATGLTVTGVEVEQIGKGIGVIGAVYRCTLTGDDVPATLVIKLTGLDEAAAMTGTVLRMYEREVKFFRSLADDAPIRVPKGYFGQVSEDGSVLNLIMEDFGDLRMVDQVEGMSLEDAERAVDNLAKWHATWWNNVADHAETGAALHLHDPLYPALLPMLYTEGWEKLMASENCMPPERVQAIGLRWNEAVAGLLQQLGNGSVTILHGDYRADNLLFDSNNDLALIDFQLTGVGSPAYDMAYFVTQSLTPDVAADQEKALIERWTKGMIANGVPEADLEDIWEDYRAATLFCLVYPVVAVRGMDLSDEREAGLANAMLRRFARADADLDLIGLLD